MSFSTNTSQNKRLRTSSPVAPFCQYSKRLRYEKGRCKPELQDEIVKLNEQGTANFQCGNMEEAGDFFSRALNKLSEGSNCNRRQSIPKASATTHPIEDKNNTNSNVYDTCNRPSTNKDNVGHENNTISRCHEQNTNCVQNSFQYDEGMHVFQNTMDMTNNDAFHLSNNSVKNNIIHHPFEATLWFNLGQVDIQLNKYASACKKFKMALEKQLIVDGHSEADGDILPIYHNLGYCYYRLGAYKDAEKFFFVALKALGNVSKHCELNEPATKNCLGVVLMYISSERTGKNENDGASKSLLEVASTYLQESLNVYKHIATIKNQQKDLQRQSAGLEGFTARDFSKTIATVLNNLGRVYHLQGEYERAIDAYNEALQLRQSCTDPLVLDSFATLYNIAKSHQERNEINKAISFYQEAWDMMRHNDCCTICCANQRDKVCRCNPSDLLAVVTSIAEIHHLRNEKDKCVAMYEAAIKLCQQFCGTTATRCFNLAALWNKLGTVLFEHKHSQEALECFEKTLVLEQNIFGRHHERTIATMTNIAHLHRYNRQYMEAYAHYDRVRVIQIESLGEDHIDVAKTLGHMGLMKYHLLMYSDAFRLYQDALRIQREHFGSDEHLEIASTLNSIGLVLFYRLDELASYDSSLYWHKHLAKVVFMESLRVRTLILGCDSIEVAISCYNLATLCMDVGEDERAISLYRETLRIEKLHQRLNKVEGEQSRGKRDTGEDGSAQCYHNDMVVTLQQLGLLHQQRGELDEALECLGEALEMERQKCNGRDVVSTYQNQQNQMVIAKLLNLIGNLQLQRANVPEMMNSYAEAMRIFQGMERTNPDTPRRNTSLLIAGYNFYALSRMNPPCAPVA